MRGGADANAKAPAIIAGGHSYILSRAAVDCADNYKSNPFIKYGHWMSKMWTQCSTLQMIFLPKIGLGLSTINRLQKCVCVFNPPTNPSRAYLFGGIHGGAIPTLRNYLTKPRAACGYTHHHVTNSNKTI